MSLTSQKGNKGKKLIIYYMTIRKEKKVVAKLKSYSSEKYVFI
jgi:hypothetical protein